MTPQLLLIDDVRCIFVHATSPVEGRGYSSEGDKESGEVLDMFKSDGEPTTAPHNRGCGDMFALIVIAVLSVPTAILYWVA